MWESVVSSVFVTTVLLVAEMRKGMTQVQNVTLLVSPFTSRTVMGQVYRLLRTEALNILFMRAGSSPRAPRKMTL